MKVRFVCFLAALCLLLGGCNWMDGSYVSVTPHQSHSQTGTGTELSAANSDELRQALNDLIAVGKEKGVIFVGGYDQSKVKSGMAAAVSHTLNMTPLGAYAVEAIDWDLGNSGGKPAIAVNITYRRSLTELRKIRYVGSMEDAGNAILGALTDNSATLVLGVRNYEAVDVDQLVADYAQTYPQRIMEVPQVTVGVYPESGEMRIVELKFSYQNSRDDLRKMREQVDSMFDAAERYVSSDDSDGAKYSKMYAFLMGLYREQETSITPAYSLLQHGVGDARALTTVYAAMCRQAGLECQVVTGTWGGEPRYWLIILDGGNYFHVDLLRCMEMDGFHRFTDVEMGGYVWDYSAYPACPGIPAPAEEPPAGDPGPEEAPTEGAGEETEATEKEKFE